MDQPPLVVLLGDSLLLDSVAMSLRDTRPLGVVQIRAGSTDAGERLRSLHPDLIVFELNCTGSVALLEVLKEQPGTALLGLNLEWCQVILLNTRQHVTQTMQELCQLVQSQVNCER